METIENKIPELCKRVIQYAGYGDVSEKAYFGDCRESMRQMICEGIKVQTCVTSPPYWGLRDYGVDGQLGLEKTPDKYVDNMVEVFRLVKELLNDDGILWLNLGDSYSGNKGDNRSPEQLAKSSTLGPKRNGLGGNNAGHMCHSFAPRNISTPGIKQKDLVGIPWMVAFALRNDGWYLRQDIIWSKPNPMPESVTDRCTKSHEYLFMFSKKKKYYYDQEAIKEPAIYYDKDPRPAGIVRDRELGYNSKESVIRNRKPIYKDAKSYNGKNSDKQRGHSRRHAGFNDRWDRMTKDEQCSALRNKRSVWTIPTKPYPDAHFATYPPQLIEPCILTGSRVGDIVLDPFFGSGTTGQVAQNLGRQWIGCELNQEYETLQKKRTNQLAMQS